MEKSDNELIAEFMGNQYTNNVWRFLHPFKRAVLHSGDLQYNESWDWLMPVVLKIRLLLNDNELYKKTKERNFWNVIMFSFQAVSIEATYIPVVEFIKWYNQQTLNA